MQRPLLTTTRRLLSCLPLAMTAVSIPSAAVLAGDYRIERIASGLNQPNYITQAPGDPANILYYVERVQPPTDGSYSIQAFNEVNHMGKVVRYDTNTGTKTTVLDLYDQKVFQDTGLQSVAFSPDFQTNGKMYVVTSEYVGTQAFGSNGTGTQPVPLDRVREYTVNTASPSAASTVLNQTIIRYSNNVGNNHTINWAGFDPTATGDARNYLYISTGDSSFGNNYNGGISPTGRPSQNPTDVRGKILRVEVGGSDAYPADNNKNFAIPASNPIPAYNAAHPGAPLNGLEEVYITGMRNAYRASFDRANGDLYMGDVGENLLEEVDFLRAGTNSGATGPADFGWPQLEGTAASGIGGAPHTSINPFTGVTSINPIRQYPHSGGSAVIGGYVYRGPIVGLQGRYFYADFVPGTVNALDFDPNTPPASFNGANGMVTDFTTLLNSLVFDASDANYTATGAGAPFGLDHVVSFGEDSAGNMYVVDFGGTAGDAGFSNATGEYPAGGLGEIFRFVLNGDLDRNNVRNAADIDALARSEPGAVGVRSRLYDLNNDNNVNPTPNSAGSDLDYFVHTLLHTEYGDANLDHAIDFDDLVILAQNYNASGIDIGWADADFDSNFVVDFGDLVQLAQHYNFANAGIVDGAGSEFAADWALAQNLVPEPASVLTLTGIAVTGIRRQRVTR
jgi:hypothetical protein